MRLRERLEQRSDVKASASARIRALAEEIQDARAGGYSYTAIAKALNEIGIAVRPETIRRTLARTKAARHRTAPMPLERQVAKPLVTLTDRAASAAAKASATPLLTPRLAKPIGDNGEFLAQIEAAKARTALTRTLRNATDKSIK